MNTTRTKISRIAAITEGFALYVLTGSACLVIGATLQQLIGHFQAGLAAVAALGSTFAIGRVCTVFFVGRLTERLGPKLIIGAGLILLFCFYSGIALARTIPAAMISAALGGIGMGTQDTAGPVLFLRVFPRHYPSAMSAGQAFFGVGCFLPSLIMGFLLSRELSFVYTYYIFAGFCVLMLLILPLMQGGKEEHSGLVHNEKTKPAGRKQEKAALRWFLFACICVFYCFATNTINLYTPSYAVSLGLSGERGVNLLSLYSAGCMLGALGFSLVLRRVRPITLLCTNLVEALACMVLLFVFKSFIPMGILFFCTGLGLGVLFSLVVVIAVELNPSKAGRAGAVVAILCGGADIAAPLVTGAVITVTEIGVNRWFICLSLAVALGAMLVFRFITKEKLTANAA
jgi:MFS family permease